LARLVVGPIAAADPITALVAFTTATTTASISALIVTPVVTVADMSHYGGTTASLVSCAVASAIAGDVVACTSTATFDSATAEACHEKENVLPMTRRCIPSTQPMRWLCASIAG